MPTIEKTVPYSLAECMQRLNALNEAPTSDSEEAAPNIVVNLLSIWGRTAYQTLAKKISGDDQSVLYHIERSPQSFRSFLFLSAAQIDLKLEAETADKTIITYSIEVWNSVKLALIGIGLIGGSLMLFFFVSLSLAQVIFAVIAVVLTFVFHLMNIQTQSNILEHQLQAILRD